jgi:hypothetical protein
VVSGATVVLSGLTITNGYVLHYGYGGGISNYAGTVTLNSATVSDNSAVLEGGGIYNYRGTVTLNNATVSGNSAEGVYDYESGVYVGGNGGGISNFHGTVTLNNATVSGNDAFGGGGIYNYTGTVTLNNATVGGNHAIDGGGIYNFNGTLALNNSTVSGNTVVSFAGGNDGADIYNVGTLALNNTTVSSNSTSGGGGGRGGGLFNLGTVTLNNATISGNSARDGGGIYNSLGRTLTARNTILAGNSAPTARDVSGDLGSLGHNLIGNTSGGGGFDPTDLLNVDPRLGPLQDNGGPTQTMALLPGSPALNAGDPSQLGTADQRGVVRSGGVNIGAYQASASAFVLTAPATITTGAPFDVTVQAVDVFGQVAFGYRGTGTFRVTDPDPAVVLPADYTFTADDQGTHTFTGEFTLITPGMWTLTAADLANELTRDVMVPVDT